MNSKTESISSNDVYPKHRNKRKHKNPRKPDVSQKYSEVEHTKVLAEVWDTALKLASKDPKRIEIIRVDCVIVHNKANWRNPQSASRP